MKKTTSLALALVVGCQLMAQEKLSLGAGIGTNFMFLSDLKKQEQDPNRMDLAAYADLQYEFSKSFSLRGRLQAGSFDGGEYGVVYETSYIAASLFADYNWVPLFSKNAKWQLATTLGGGWQMFYGNLYADNGDFIYHVPGNGKAWSQSPYVAGGMYVSIPLVRKIDLRLGIDHAYHFGNDYVDAFKSGEAPDAVQYAWLGVNFYLRDEFKKGEMKVKKTDYDNLNTQIAEAKERAQIEKAKGEMRLKEKDLQIQALRDELDSLRANAVKVAATDSAKTPDANDLMKEPAWRIIVGSYPSQALAQRSIDRSSLDKSQMFVAYIESLNTYRVVYKSYPTQAAALKELGTIRQTVSDAWIVKF